MGKSKSKVRASVKKAKTVKIAMNKELAASIAALEKVVVPTNLVDCRDRLIVSLTKLNDRIHTEARKAVKTAEREAAKVIREKAKAERAAAKAERNKAKAVKLQEQIRKLQAQVSSLS